MPKYNPDIHKRRSIRLKGYDYSQAGMYFVTICCQDNICRFGKIENGEMYLNDAGKMVEKWCAELSNKFPDIFLNTYIIMPNHFHAIIVNNGDAGGVGADLRVCPDDNEQRVGAHLRVRPDIDKPDVGQTHDSGQTRRSAPTDERNNDNNILGEHTGSLLGEHTGSLLGEHTGSPLHAVVQWFKTMTTNEYIRGVKTLDWQPFNKKLWQRNYHEHIIRNNNSYQQIADYIENNPANWQKDRFFNK